MARLNPGHKYGRFLSLVERAGFPKDVHAYLSVGLGMTSMEEFVGPDTLKLIEHGASVGYIDYATKCEALSHWNAARKAHGVYKTPRDNEIQEENDMNGENIAAGRNEMIALLQASKGAKFALVTTSAKGRGTLLTYKYIPQHVGELAVGDIVVCQRGTVDYLVGTVDSILDEPPTTDEYNYNITLRHIIRKVDVEKSEALRELDRRMLKAITASEATDRLERLMRQLGTTADAISMDLPKVIED